MAASKSIFPVITIVFFIILAIAPCFSKEVNGILSVSKYANEVTSGGKNANVAIIGGKHVNVVTSGGKLGVVKSSYDYVHPNSIEIDTKTQKVYKEMFEDIFEDSKYILKLLMQNEQAKYEWFNELPLGIIQSITTSDYLNMENILDLISSISKSEIFNIIIEYIENSSFMRESFTIMTSILDNYEILNMDFSNNNLEIQDKDPNENNKKESKAATEKKITHLDLQETNHTVSDNEPPSGIWMSIKSTLQRGLSFLDKEMALSDLQSMIPTHIIEGFLSFGDEVNVLNFLSQKLDPDFSEFLVQKIEPYLGSLRSMNNFYEFIQKKGFSYILDYIDPRSFSDIDFSIIINEASRLSATLFDSTFSPEVLSKYMIFGDFTQISDILKTIQSNSVASEDSFVSGIFNLVTSLLTSPVYFKQNDESVDNDIHSYADGSAYYDSNENEIQGQDRGENLERSKKMSHTSTVTSNDDSGAYYDSIEYEIQDQDQSENLKRFKRMSHLSTVTSKYGPSHETVRIESRQISRDSGYGHSGGGYGGGGYGYGGGYGMMQGLDPFVLLGSIALASLLGYLLFLVITTPGGGRRSLDGEFMSNLWLTDLPNPLSGWGPEMSRGKRGLNDEPRGNTTNFSQDSENDDLPPQLNQLWHIHKTTNESACVREALCDIINQNTADHVYTAMSRAPLILASVSNLLGVDGPGQMLDQITNTIISGETFTCPSLASCQF